MDRMIARDEDYRYSVAWIDSVHPAGRGVLTRGDHAPADWLTGKQAQAPLAFNPKALVTAPAVVPAGLVNPLTMRAFNEAWFRKAPRTRQGELQPIGAFFHPARHRAATGTASTGPAASCSTSSPCPTRRAISSAGARALRAVGALSALTVLKRFGAANPAPLSFPQPGWTLAVDVPAGVDGLAATLDALDEQVLAAGGRLYLAKDSRMSPG